MADLDDDDRSGRTWTLLAALAVVVIIVAVGGWLVISGNDDDDNSTAATPGGGSAPSDYIGPRAIEGGLPVGFAHTAAGSQAAATTWVSYALASPDSRLPDGLEVVVDDIDLLGRDPERNGSLTASPVAVGEGIEGDSGVVKVLLVKTQTDPSTLPVVDVGMLSVAVTLTWSTDANDWRLTDAEILRDFVPPLSVDDFVGYRWVGPVSIVAGEPLVGG